MSGHERAVFFPAAGQMLFGILAEPVAARFDDLAVVVLPEGVPGGTRAQNGVLVSLARAVAASGYASFRLDYHGTGESTGPIPATRRDRPFLQDLDAALGWLGQHGYKRFLVAGSCSGANTALLAVPDRPEIVGVALLSCLLSADDSSPIPPSPAVLRSLAVATERDVPSLFVYGREDACHAEFEAARPLGLDDLLAADRVDVEVLDGRIHSFLDVDLQRPVIDLVVGWLDRTARSLPGLATVAESWTSR